ncbi:hypothetical protein K492DRAFT_177395 [Lichtheimia hyalospora FSU 10163]|nr:hypothetical protein K492DRAFT_177395 [Lichtheimia hyalospora FSU 10163]
MTCMDLKVHPLLMVTLKKKTIIEKYDDDADEQKYGKKRRKLNDEDEQGDAALERNLHISDGAPVERNQNIPGLALNNRFIKFKSALSKIQFKDIKPTGYHVDYSQQHSERVRLAIDKYKSTVTSDMHSLHHLVLLHVHAEVHPHYRCSQLFRTSAKQYWSMANSRSPMLKSLQLFDRTCLTLNKHCTTAS